MMTRINHALKVFSIACLATATPAWGYVAYMHFFYTPPPPIPCRQDMTLQPDQSCYGVITLNSIVEN